MDDNMAPIAARATTSVTKVKGPFQSLYQVPYLIYSYGVGTSRYVTIDLCVVGAEKSKYRVSITPDRKFFLCFYVTSKCVYEPQEA